MATDREQELLRQAYEQGIRVYFNNSLPEGRRGEYRHSTQEIFIRKSMSTVQRICTLQHEIIHAELGHIGEQSEQTEQWVNEQAALRLISPTEYAITERIYGADRFLLARELEVTPTIIDAYQRILQKNHSTQTPSKNNS